VWYFSIGLILVVLQNPIEKYHTVRTVLPESNRKIPHYQNSTIRIQKVSTKISGLKPREKNTENSVDIWVLEEAQ
jgi:hypothetical protein